MLLNFGLPTGTPTVTVAPKSNIDIDAILGLKPSQYEGFKSLRDTGYYYGDGSLYEPYTPSPVQYGRMIMGQWSPISGQFGMPYQPSYGIGGGLSGGVSARGGAVAGTITKDGQSFRPVDTDVEGFVRSQIEDPDSPNNGQYRYRPSMAYVYSNMPKQTYTPTPLNNVTSFLSAPIAPANTYTGNYGAGRFLNAGSLLPAIDYSAPQTVSSSA